MSVAAVRWLALLDVAVWLTTTSHRRDPQALGRSRIAFDALAAFEHTLTPSERRHAREIAWARDSPAPLPDERAWWGWCQCRSCQLARHLGTLVIVSPAPQRETPPTQPIPPTSTQQPHLEQGESLPC